MAVRRRLHAAGLRYRVDFKPERSLPRRADIVFTRRRVAVFIDGCFWHGCREHRTLPKVNQHFWREKIAANVSRDIDTTQRLEAAGWTVLRFWEHDEPDAAVCLIRSVLASEM